MLKKRKKKKPYETHWDKKKRGEKELLLLFTYFGPEETEDCLE